MTVGRTEATIKARKLALTEAARLEEFTIEDVWQACGRGELPSYQHVQALLRELFVEGLLERVDREGQRRKPVHYRWSDGEVRPPEGADSAQEAIAEEICATVHHRDGMTYAGGHCEECMKVAEYAVRVVRAGLP